MLQSGIFNVFLLYVTPFPHCIFVTLCHALPPLYFCNTLRMYVMFSFCLLLMHFIYE